MRIAITVDPEIPVPPLYYGGIERIVDLLVRGLVEQGHAVTLFAHPGSRVPCRLLPYPALRSQSPGDLIRNMAHVSRELLIGHYDVVHSFARLAYLLPLLPLSLPKIMSYQRNISPRSVQLGDVLSRDTLHFTACSRRLMEPWAGRRNWHVVYNATSARTYTFQPRVDDQAPLVFLGRIERIKGPHLAVQVARASGLPLIVAGNLSTDAEERTYFAREVEPFIDGTQIQYVGPVDDRQKNELLGRARALLMPIQWEEPFGIVMVEALACGTPVIALDKGAVPEVVSHGVTGFVCRSVDDMMIGAARLATIERAACRADMESRFSQPVMVRNYLDLYHRIASRPT